MPCPAMTAGVVEGVDERQALGVADALHLRERLADVRAMEDDPGAVAEAGIHLRPDRACRHDDRDRDARRAAGPGVRLARVAGGQRDDAPRSAPREPASRSGSTCRAP